MSSYSSITFAHHRDQQQVIIHLVCQGTGVNIPCEKSPDSRMSHKCRNCLQLVNYSPTRGGKSYWAAVDTLNTWNCNESIVLFIILLCFSKKQKFQLHMGVFPTYMSVHHMCTWCYKARGRHQIPWVWSYVQLWATMGAGSGAWTSGEQHLLGCWAASLTFFPYQP